MDIKLVDAIEERWDEDEECYRHRALYRQLLSRSSPIHQLFVRYNSEMGTPFKTVLLIGAGGSIGSVVLKALLAEPSLSVTVLQRASSKSKLHPHLKVITVPDSYPTEELVTAFKGQEAIINCMATFSVTDQYRIIHAAITAGVRRYSPSEYGLNNMRPEAQALSTVFAEKGEVQAYLRAKASQGLIEWMSISCGMWPGLSRTRSWA